MRALHLGLRVTDLGRALTFYRAVGYEVVGEVPDTGIGHLTMLKLPGDDFVTLESSAPRRWAKRAPTRFEYAREGPRLGTTATQSLRRRFVGGVVPRRPRRDGRIRVLHARWRRFSR